jgi:2-methylcitrate dehydratase PrpD
MLTQRFARSVLETRDIPAEALAAARDALLDTLGCALAGSLEHTAEIVQRWVQENGSRPVASVWGTPLASSPMDAAFANGVASHALDFDDSLPTLRGHPSATIVPASVAAGELAGASGKAVAEAIVIGVEVAGIIGQALGAGHYMRGWHTTATAGTLAATAAAARVLGLTTEQLQQAWGLAASQTAGLVRNFGTMTKPFHAGNAARSALAAVTFARAGFTANAEIFEGKNSYFDTYGGAEREPLEKLLAAFGKPWQIVKPGIYVKRWPCCYCNHRPVGGLLQLMKEHQIKADEVTAVRIGFLPGSDEALVSTDPHTGLEGKFSIEYCAAATLLDGKLTLDTFTDAMVQRPAIRPLMKKVRREHVEAKGLYSGIVGYTDVILETTRGKFETRVNHAPGSPEWPMTSADRAEKFLDCAGRVLGDKGARRLLELGQRCTDLADIRELAKATLPSSSTPRTPSTAAVS